MPTKPFRYSQPLLRAFNRLRIAVRHKGEIRTYVRITLDSRESVSMRLTIPEQARPGDVLTINITQPNLNHIQALATSAGRERAEHAAAAKRERARHISR